MRFSCGAFVRKTSVVDMDVHDDHAHRGAARRRRSAVCARFCATRSSLSRCRWPLCLTQTTTYTDAATFAATASPAATCAVTPAPSPEIEHVVPAPVATRVLGTVQPHVIFQEIPEVHVVERIQERIVETIEVLLHERVRQFTAEQKLCTCQSLRSISRVPSPMLLRSLIRSLSRKRLPHLLT